MSQPIPTCSVCEQPVPVTPIELVHPVQLKGSICSNCLKAFEGLYKHLRTRLKSKMV